MYTLQESIISQFNLEQVGALHGQPLFSSDKVKRKYLEILDNSHFSKVIDKVDRMVERDTIIPVYGTNNLMSYIYNKISASPISKSMIAYYDIPQNKIFIIMSSMTRFMFWTKNDKIVTSTSHELMHYAANNNTRKFYGLFKKEIFTFYKSLFEDIFDNEIIVDAKFVGKISNYLHSNFESKENISRNAIYKYAQFLDKLVKQQSSDKEDMSDHINSYLAVVKMFIEYPYSFVSFANNSSQAKNVIAMLYRAYKKIGINDPQSMPIQETIFPSEIVSILSEYPSGKYYSLIKSL